MSIFRSMSISIVTIAAGAAAGAFAGGAPGAFLGAVLGLLAGLLWAGTRDAVTAPRGATHLEEARLLCLPTGSMADCTLRREDDGGRWVDVERCSLCAPADDVGCRKRCLVLLNDGARTGS